VLPALFDLAEIPLELPYPLEVKLPAADFEGLYALYRKERIQRGLVPVDPQLFAEGRRITIF
jgi:hypothetical protein